MKPYACSRVNSADQKLLHNIGKVIKCMPEVDLELDEKSQKRLVSCHMLARAVAAFFPVKVHDGYFFKIAYYHSWVTTEKSLIDIYPIAMIGGPILIDNTCFNPWSRQYVDRGMTILSFDTDEKRFINDVAKVTEIMGQTMEQLGMKAKPLKNIET